MMGYENDVVRQVKTNDDIELIDFTRNGYKTMWVVGDLESLDLEDSGYTMERINDDDVHKLTKTDPELGFLQAEVGDRVRIEYRSARSHNLIEAEGVVEDLPGTEEGEGHFVAIRDEDSDDDPYEMRRILVNQHCYASSYRYEPVEDNFGHFEYVQYHYVKSCKLGNVYAFDIL